MASQSLGSVEGFPTVLTFEFNICGGSLGFVYFGNDGDDDGWEFQKIACWLGIIREYYPICGLILRVILLMELEEGGEGELMIEWLFIGVDMVVYLILDTGSGSIGYGWVTGVVEVIVEDLRYCMIMYIVVAIDDTDVWIIGLSHLNLI